MRMANADLVRNAAYYTLRFVRSSGKMETRTLMEGDVMEDVENSIQMHADNLSRTGHAHTKSADSTTFLGLKRLRDPIKGETMVQDLTKVETKTRMGKTAETYKGKLRLSPTAKETEERKKNRLTSKQLKEKRADSNRQIGSVI